MPESPTAVITPYLCVHDGVAALAFYKAAFDAVETVRYTGDDGQIGHAEVEILGARVMLSDEWAAGQVYSPKHYGGSSTTLHLNVPGVDAVVARAAAAGATVVRPPSDEAYGERGATIIDPFGHRWMIASTISQPTLDEINAGMTGYTVTAPTSGS